MKNTLLLFVMLSIGGFVAEAQSIQEFYKEAAENNPGLKAKYVEFEAALQRVPQVSTLADPTFSFGYFISPVETRVGPQIAKLSLTQMFPWFGTLKAQSDAASLQAQAKYQDFLDAQNKLYYQVAAVYYPLLEIENLVEIEQSNISILSSYKAIATVKYENGKSSMVDVLRADIMLKSAETNLSLLQKREAATKSWFNSLLNRKFDAPLQLNDKLEINEGDLVLLSDSLANNPLLSGLDLKMHASEAAQLAANRQGLPKIGVGLDYVFVGPRTDMDLPQNGQDVFMPMISVSLPIFRGKYNGAKEEARLMRESYSFQKEDLTNRLYGSFYKVQYELQKQMELIALYNAQISESEQSLNLLYSAYSNSGKDFEEVLRMQQQLLELQKLKVNALLGFKLATAEMDYITAKKLN